MTDQEICAVLNLLQQNLADLNREIRRVVLSRNALPPERMQSIAALLAADWKAVSVEDLILFSRQIAAITTELKQASPNEFPKAFDSEPCINAAPSQNDEKEPRKH